MSSTFGSPWDVPGKGRQQEHCGGQLLAVTFQQAGGPPALACLRNLAPTWLATGLLRIGSKQCRPGKRNVHPKEENNEDKESGLPQCAGGRVISF